MEERNSPTPTFDEFAEAVARQLCKTQGRDPNEFVAVAPYPGCVVDSTGSAHVPLYATMAAPVVDYLRITEAVKIVADSFRTGSAS